MLVRGRTVEPNSPATSPFAGGKRGGSGMYNNCDYYHCFFGVGMVLKWFRSGAQIYYKPYDGNSNKRRHFEKSPYIVINPMALRSNSL